MMDIIIIIFTLLAIAVVFNISTWISGRIIGLKLKEFSIGFGPNIFKSFFGNSSLSIRLLPTGGSVDFYIESAEDGLKPLELHKLNSVQKILLAAPGPLSQLAIGSFFLMAGVSHTSAIIAILSIITGIFGLLPLPSQNGFILATILIPSFRNKPLDQILPSKILIPILFIFLALYYGFLVYFMFFT